tara:strand:+ start:5459 stop:5641 length:183 start_codon:yes stop_codon:yes gene_type:complete
VTLCVNPKSFSKKERKQHWKMATKPMDMPVYGKSLLVTFNRLWTTKEVAHIPTCKAGFWK